MSLSWAMAAAISVGVAGTAHAITINNDPGTIHYVNAADEKQCLMNDPGTGFIEAWRCLNAPSEEWTASGPLGGPVNMANFWTGTCMAVTGYPFNNVPVVSVPCNANDAKQLWRMEMMEQKDGLTFYRFHSVLNGDQCLDKPKGVNADGTHIHMWACANQHNPNPFDPTFNYHKEQYWGGL